MMEVKRSLIGNFPSLLLFSVLLSRKKSNNRKFLPVKMSGIDRGLVPIGLKLMVKVTAWEDYVYKP